MVPPGLDRLETLRLGEITAPASIKPPPAESKGELRHKDSSWTRPSTNDKEHPPLARSSFDGPTGVFSGSYKDERTPPSRYMDRERDRERDRSRDRDYDRDRRGRDRRSRSGSPRRHSHVNQGGRGRVDWSLSNCVANLD